MRRGVLGGGSSSEEDVLGVRGLRFAGLRFATVAGFTDFTGLTGLGGLVGLVGSGEVLGERLLGLSAGGRDRLGGFHDNWFFRESIRDSRSLDLVE